MHEFIYMQKQTKNNNKTNKQSSCIHKISSSSASFQLEWRMKNTVQKNLTLKHLIHTTKNLHASYFLQPNTFEKCFRDADVNLHSLSTFGTPFPQFLHISLSTQYVPVRKD